MLNKIKQLASFINLPVLVVFVSFTVICFVIVKFLQAYFFPKSAKKSKLVSKSKDGSIKTVSRKKRNKKQRSLEIASEQSMKRDAVPVDDEAVVTSNKTKTNEKPSTPIIEVERVSQLNKKLDKKKGKSKKKKAQNNDIDVTSASVAVNGTQSVVEEGEWQTVRSKEQKVQRKEKRRQDETVTPPLKSTTVTPFTPSYTSIPSTAKDVAPRFARAAGEEWQEGASKRQSVNVTKSTTILNRSPMIPAAAQQQQPPTNKWASPVTTAPLPDIWESKTTTSIGFSSTQHTWSTNKTNAIPWTTNVKPNSWATKPAAPAWETEDNVEISDKENLNVRRRSQSKLLQFGDISPSSVRDVELFIFRSPYSRGSTGGAFSSPIRPSAFPEVLPHTENSLWSAALDKSEWHNDSKPDDWVHVTAPSPTSAALSETWATADVYPQALHQWSEVRISDQTSNGVPSQPKERFHMEPEGVSVSSLDPDDPWNMDTYEKEGDWSPPEAHWSNPQEEWTAPVPVTKPQPTYFDESSEEEKVTASVPLQSVSAPHTVVGAGNELIQTQNQQSNKKARRRRKKKQSSDAVNDATSKVSETVSATIEETTKVSAPKVTGTTDAMDEIHANDNWSVSKQSKKKKPRARKAE